MGGGLDLHGAVSVRWVGGLCGGYGAGWPPVTRVKPVTPAQDYNLSSREVH